MDPSFPATPAQMQQRIADDVAAAKVETVVALAEAQVVADAEPLAEVNKAIAEQLEAEKAEDAEAAKASAKGAPFDEPLGVIKDEVTSPGTKTPSKDTSKDASKAHDSKSKSR